MNDRMVLVLLVLADIGLTAWSGVWLHTRPRSTSLSLVYALTVVVAIAVTAMMVVPAIAEPGVGNTIGAAAWLGVLASQLYLYRSQAGALHRTVVWDPDTRRWLPGRTWHAALAPIGAPTTDGRRGLLAGEWSVTPGGAPVWVDDLDAPGGLRVIGRVDRVWLDGDLLMAAGVVARHADLTDLLPEVSITPVRDLARADPGGLMLFPAGRVTGVRMGNRPVFSGVWLRYDDERTS